MNYEDANYEMYLDRTVHLYVARNACMNYKTTPHSSTELAHVDRLKSEDAR